MLPLHPLPLTDQLHRIAQVPSGKQLVLNVVGSTLALKEPYLHLPIREVRCLNCSLRSKASVVEFPTPLGRQIHFGPTPIGLPQPQRHTIELPNYSGAPLMYKVDTSAINELNTNNFGFPILVSLKK